MTTLELSHDQVQCLASRGRAKVLGTLRSLGPSPVKEIATASHLSIETTHYHVRQMAQAGLVRQKGMAPSGKRPMAIYELVADRFVFPSPSAAKERLLVGQAMRAMVETSAAEYENAGFASLRPYLLRLSLKVHPDQLPSVFRILEEAEQALLGLPRVEDGISVSATLLATPV